jgi:hypothetical protein
MFITNILATPVSVFNGGTGSSSFNAYGVLCAGTSSIGAIQSLSSVGTLGQVLTSQGAAALPQWTTPTVTLPATPLGSLQMCGLGSASTTFAAVSGWSSDSLGQVTAQSQGIADVPLTLVTSATPTASDYLLQMKSGGSTIAGFLNNGALVIGSNPNNRFLSVYYNPGVSTTAAGMDFGNSASGGALFGLLATATGNALGGNKALFRDDSAGTFMQTFDFTNARIGIGNSASISGVATSPQGLLHVVSTTNTEVVSIFQAASGQSTDVTQWKTSGGVITDRVDLNGAFFVLPIARTSGNNPTLIITPPNDTGQTGNNPQFVVNGRVGGYSGGGTIPMLVSNSFGQDTISGSASTTTVTNAYGAVFNAPVAGNASTTLTSSYALGTIGQLQVMGATGNATQSVNVWNDGTRGYIQSLEADLYLRPQNGIGLRIINDASNRTVLQSEASIIWFNNNVGTALFSPNGSGGAAVALLGNSASSYFRGQAGFGYGWCSNADAGAAGIDTSIIRSSAAVIQITNGSSGQGALICGSPAIGTAGLTVNGITLQTQQLVTLNLGSGASGDFLDCINGSDVFKIVSTGAIAMTTTAGDAINVQNIGAVSTYIILNSYLDLYQTLWGTVWNANDICGGSAAGDAVLRTNNGNILFSTNNGSSADLKVKYLGGTFVQPQSRTSGNNQTLTITAPGDSSITAGANSPNVLYTPSTRQWLTGAIAEQDSWQLSSDTYSAVGASTMTLGAMLTVKAPVAGANVTANQLVSINAPGGIATTQLSSANTTNVPVQINSQYGSWMTDTFASSMTFNMALNDKHAVTLTGNTTISFSNNQPGQVMLCRLGNDSVGGHTVTWNLTNLRWQNKTAPTQTTTANAVDLYTFVEDLGSSSIFGEYVQNF